MPLDETQGQPSRRRKPRKPTTQEWRGLFLKGLRSKTDPEPKLSERTHFDELGRPVVYATKDAGGELVRARFSLVQEPSYGILDGWRIGLSAVEWSRRA